MFARMPRYALAASGIRRAPRIPATGQNGSSRHVQALFDSSSRRINEQSSGLLIRGFGVQVPGGAPVLTWGFINHSVFSSCPVCPHVVPMLAPCLLGRPMVGLRQLVENKSDHAQGSGTAQGQPVIDVPAGLPSAADSCDPGSTQRAWIGPDHALPRR
jgi:hypothetical protein